MISSSNKGNYIEHGRENKIIRSLKGKALRIFTITTSLMTIWAIVIMKHYYNGVKVCMCNGRKPGKVCMCNGRNPYGYHSL